MSNSHESQPVTILSTSRLVLSAYHALEEVFDPELAIDIVSLGLVYGVDELPDKSLRIRMTLTTPGCPVSEGLPLQVQSSVEAATGTQVEVEVVWSPEWDPTMMSTAARERLGAR